MELHEITEQAPERALLVSVDTGEFDAAVSLAELAELAATAGAEVAAPPRRKRRRRTRPPALARRARRLRCSVRAEDTTW